MSKEKCSVFIEEKLATIFMEIKVFPCTNGYELLKDVVLQISLDTSKKLNMNKKVFPKLAQSYNVSVSQIERRLKTLCETCKTGINQVICENLFGCENIESFSVKQVICALAEKLKLECQFCKS